MFSLALSVLKAPLGRCSAWPCGGTGFSKSKNPAMAAVAPRHRETCRENQALASLTHPEMWTLAVEEQGPAQRTVLVRTYSETTEQSAGC